MSGSSSLSRLRYLFEREGFRYDLINAALGAGLDNILHASRPGEGPRRAEGQPPVRAVHPDGQAGQQHPGRDSRPARTPSPDLFVEKAERELYSTFTIVRDNVAPMIAKGDFVQAQKIVFRLQPALNVFFEKVLVMAEDAKLRKNRLALLQAIRKILVQMADYSQVVVEARPPLRSRRSGDLALHGAQNSVRGR